MSWTIPNILTLLRIILIPVLVVVFYMPGQWSYQISAAIFGLASLTDLLDGYLARRLNQSSAFGAFLDPVADKLMVAVALVLLVQRQETYQVVFAIAAAIIIGREITISALREWMSEIGESARVKDSWAGKLKTIFQMTAIGFLLYREDIGFIPVAMIGEWLLYTAAALTLWSMWNYLASAWPAIRDPRPGDDP